MRHRRRPAEAEEEIINAAEATLREGGMVALTPAAVMARTGLSRSSFYVYMRDIPDLLSRLLTRIEGELFEMALVWLAGDGDRIAEARRSVEGIVAVYERHGPVLRALGDAATYDPIVAKAFRHGVLDHFMVAIESRLDDERSRGRIRHELPPQTTRALVLMTERFLAETLGGPDPLPRAEVVAALEVIWSRTLYDVDRGAQGHV